MTYTIPDPISPCGQSFKQNYGNVLTPNKEIPMNQSPQINELATALSKAQSEMSFASKDSINPHFKSKYADLSAVWDAIRVPLTKHGLSVTQILETMGDQIILVSILMHSSGQWIKSTLPVINANKTSQGQGSGITYCRRYALAALVGCVQDDDDAEASMPKDRDKSKKTQDKPESNPTPLTKEQTKELHELADLCDPEYIGKLYSYLESQGVRGFDNLMSNNFTKVITGMRSNAESFQKGK